MQLRRLAPLSVERPSDDELRTFFEKTLCGRKTEAGRAADDQTALCSTESDADMTLLDATLADVLRTLPS